MGLFIALVVLLLTIVIFALIIRLCLYVFARFVMPLDPAIEKIVWTIFTIVCLIWIIEFIAGGPSIVPWITYHRGYARPYQWLSRNGM
jgi:hypothetical protein